MDIYEAAHRFTEKANRIPYPPIPRTPKREDFLNAPEYGIALGVWEKERDAAQQGRKNHNIDHSTLDQEFKMAMAKACGIPKDHPKLEKWFALAWSYGHSSGYAEVAGYCDSLAELLID